MSAAHVEQNFADFPAGDTAETSSDESCDFSDLYERHRSAVYRFIRSRVRDVNEAEDLTQETFVQAYRSLGNFEGRSSALTWLLGIARHVCLHFYRHSTRWMIGADGVGYEHDPGFDSRIESRVDASRKLDRCSELIERYRGPEHQAIFYLRYGKHIPIKTIAARIGKSRDAVKMSLTRSRRALAQHL